MKTGLAAKLLAALAVAAVFATMTNGGLLEFSKSEKKAHDVTRERSHCE